MNPTLFAAILMVVAAVGAIIAAILMVIAAVIMLIGQIMAKTKEDQAAEKEKGRGDRKWHPHANDDVKHATSPPDNDRH